MKKRGQAAMEFLMTYGWAILAAVIVIAALAFFGVFNPKTYVPNRCSLSPPFSCNGVAETSGIQLELIHGAGEQLSITDITVAGCTGTVSPTLPQDINNGNLTTFTVPCTLTAGQKFQGDIKITYKKQGSALNLTSTGNLVDAV
ncbi:MAG: hypothetical protein QW727_00705 [Candidatus Pacearchaeota archaeon]